jgi:hypothetical protein
MLPKESIVCPKCNAAMQEGYIADQGESRQLKVSEWVEGAPEYGGFWESGFWENLKTKNHKVYQVTTYRCSGCGYLESYAIHAPE